MARPSLTSSAQELFEDPFRLLIEGVTDYAIFMVPKKSINPSGY